jgi:hypothetical protein
LGRADLVPQTADGAARTIPPDEARSFALLVDIATCRKRFPLVMTMQPTSSSATICVTASCNSGSQLPVHRVELSWAIHGENRHTAFLLD